LLEGEPRIVAGHVRPEVNVTSLATAEGVQLFYATANKPHAALTLDPQSLRITDVSEGAPPLVPEPSDTAGDEQRRIVAWTEGRPERGVSLKIATVANAGIAVSTDDLGFRNPAVGMATIASTPDGAGVFAFIESDGVASELVAVRATCPAQSR
jgi:hypothetical protein